MGYVADQLEQNGIIEYKWLFQLFCGFTGGKEKMTAGTYTLSTTMDYSAIIRNLSARSSARTEVTVVIPEGSSVIHPGDGVIIISREHAILDINDIYEDSFLDSGVAEG